MAGLVVGSVTPAPGEVAQGAAAVEPLPELSGSVWGAAVEQLIRRVEALERRMAVTEQRLEPDFRQDRDSEGGDAA
jgi:hypothetical protein